MTDLSQLERELRRAEKRLKCAIKALAPKGKGGEWEEYQAAENEVLKLQRAFAAAKGEQYAESLEFPVK